MLHLISEPVATPDLTLPEIPVRVDRLRLARRLWRAMAEDGTEFGCELTAPLRDGDTLWQTNAATPGDCGGGGDGYVVRYVVRQEPEAVLEIPLDVASSAAAGIGWAIGNLHMELSAEATRLLTPDDPATRQLLERINVPFRATRAVFRPGRFVRGGAGGGAASFVQELGTGHKH
ncbi:urease accessory protein UreE [Geminisphaera colitermitum]|uniref:urease accessory protein UreE n=1 Tax=Geminisphaera colitermitum TaxID=1148786 RepID=UPI0005B944B0|nr:urease accessory protein UreE [Geminisphaera colitermitum]